jgi:hypothetical protein
MLDAQKDVSTGEMWNVLAAVVINAEVFSTGEDVLEPIYQDINKNTPTKDIQIVLRRIGRISCSAGHFEKINVE